LCMYFLCESFYVPCRIIWRMYIHI
jgi:hypothetical protein